MRLQDAETNATVEFDQRIHSGYPSWDKWVVLYHEPSSIHFQHTIVIQTKTGFALKVASDLTCKEVAP